LIRTILRSWLGPIRVDGSFGGLCGSFAAFPAVVGFSSSAGGVGFTGEPNATPCGKCRARSASVAERTRDVFFVFRGVLSSLTP